MRGHRVASCARKTHPAAAVRILSNLLCFCAIATAACVWHIGFLPATLFRVSCQRNYGCNGGSNQAET